MLLILMRRTQTADRQHVLAGALMDHCEVLFLTVSAGIYRDCDNGFSLRIKLSSEPREGACNAEQDVAGRS